MVRGMTVGNLPTTVPGRATGGGLAKIDLAQVKPIKIIKHINCQPKCLLSNFSPGANHIRVAPIKFVYCQRRF